jgi:hypothetical protein
MKKFKGKYWKGKLGAIAVALWRAAGKLARRSR